MRVPEKFYDINFDFHLREMLVTTSTSGTFDAPKEKSFRLNPPDIRQSGNY